MATEKRAILLLVLLRCTCLLLVDAASSELFEGGSYKTTFEDRDGALVYTDDTGTPYFADSLSFDAIDGKVLLGAADKLYVFNKDLTISDVYSWSSTAAGTCSNGNYVCRNHIRIYQRPSQDSSYLFVCGTQSGVQPQCRILNITGSSLVEAGPASPTSLVSAHPDLPGFGEFRRGGASDDVYFTANFRTTSPVSEDSYDISYQQVNIREDGSMVETGRLYGWNQTSTFWLNSPVVFVDYRRVDAGTPNTELYQFYFVFLRELVGQEIQSRVVRLCRNDAGVEFTNTRNNQSALIFNNFLKARIVCEREPPPGTQFLGAQDFNYNEMWSVAFNSPDGGRFHETTDSTDYIHMMYGAFSGPRIGPVGSAVCIYRASRMPDGSKRGLFDPFREDVRSSFDGNTMENSFIECEAAGRPSQFSQFVLTEHSVEQLEENPLLVADGFYITQMVVDQVCVVRSENPAECLNQDILFVGTSDGRVLKVVFATDVNEVGSFPVVAEEITLGDGYAVKEMKMDVDEGTKQLYAVTSTRVYRLPVQQCSRYANFMSCIKSRDPYCVWDARLVSCVYSNLTATGSAAGTVPVYISQNVHTGNVTLPTVRFDMTSYTTVEGARMEDRLWVTVTSDRVVGDGVVEVNINDLSARVGVNVFSSNNPIRISFRQSTSNPDLYEDSFMLEARRDGVYNGNLQFQLSLQNTVAGAVHFPQQNVTVTIIDIDGTPFRVGFDNLPSMCPVWTRLNTNASKLLSAEIAKALSLPQSNVINATLNCSQDNDEERYVTLLGALLVDPGRSTNDLLTSLDKWITGPPTPKLESFNIDVDEQCTARVPSANNTLCTPRGGVGGVAPPVSAASTGTVTGLSVIVVVVGIAAGVLLVLVLLLGVLLWRKNQSDHTGCHSSEVYPKDEGTNMSQLNGGEHNYDDVRDEHTYDDIRREHATDTPTDEPYRRSLAEKRGSVDLHIDVTPAVQRQPSFAGDTNPKSSEPLLGQRFFSESGDDHEEFSPGELTNGIHSQTNTDVVQNAAYGSISPEPAFEGSKRASLV